jgi:hypothetical protein
MSQSLPPMRYAQILDPRVDISGGDDREFQILKSGQTSTFQQYPTSNYGPSSITWQLTPPNASTILDRRLLIGVPFTVTVTGSTTDGSSLLQPGMFSVRSHPLMSVVSTTSLTLNSYTASLQSQQVIHLMEHFKSTDEYKRVFGSLFGSAEDTTQNYSDLPMASNNPLGSYGDGAVSGVLPRGAYPSFWLGSDNGTTAIFTFIAWDYAMIPPCLWEQMEQPGFTLLNTCTLSLTLNQNLARMFASSAASSATITGLSVVIGFGGGAPQPPASLWSLTSPTVFANWITPRLDQRIPDRISYPLYSLIPYIQTAGAASPYGTSQQISSQVIQFSSVPYKIYICLRPSNQYIYSTLTNTLQTPDVYAAITAINITFNNVSGLLSQAHPIQLWQLSAKNGSDQTLTDFGGIATQLSSSIGDGFKFGTQGSILAINVAEDLGLASNLAPGSSGSFNFQTQVTYVNTNVTNSSIVYELVIIPIYDGVLQLSRDSGNSQIGILSPSDVLSAPMSDMSYNEMQRLYGGNFFDDIGRGIKKVANFIKDNKLISEGLGLASDIGVPGTGIASKVAKIVGLGEGAGVYAGRQLTQREMRRALMK